MPKWAQWVGEVFPVTHALRIVRGVLLKGNTVADNLPELWPIALFTLVAVAVAAWSYHETLELSVPRRASPSRVGRRPLFFRRPGPSGCQ